jgi:hypothetical protein
MNRLCERTSMRRNRRFVRTGMSGAQIRECPEAGNATIATIATIEMNATSSADGPQACLCLSFGRRDRTVAIEKCAMLWFIHAGRVHVG